MALADEGNYSSLHVLFPTADELHDMESAGMMLRKDCQFHWHNRGYQSFAEFLQTFNSSKRKKVRRDRRRVAEQDIHFRWIRGGDADEETWRRVYELISITFLRRGSMPYFTLEFFMSIATTLADNILMIVAEKDEQAIAAAVFYDTPDALYGRYWGADAHYDALHFETCYYQGIDYCIANGRQCFEPGTQGEHKIARGFVPADTWSAHWLQHPEFYAAIEQYLQSERRHVERYVEAVNQHSPYRRESAD